MADLGHLVRLSVENEDEFTLIELQGVIEDVSGGSLDGKTLGSFHVLPGGKAAKLIVGTHELQGKFVALSKPLIATRKESGKLVVIGTVKSKYVFDKRPNNVKR
jgi:hypothetical protein